MKIAAGLFVGKMSGRFDPASAKSADNTVLHDVSHDECLEESAIKQTDRARR
ncbi:UNVERIFIED_ORG: hypothetical protein ABIC62_005898 [Burkholderia sp. 1595]|uniref:Uncharacterized protein n=1 Tax=Paraburkholderia terricola TaxID=169427 RepID=A0ABU1M1F1_9BURK|nr:hypothetical protein [Paraburkholderia terricola]MDR6485072.1 hypothetical protein [Paraburkholderia terricola]